MVIVDVDAVNVVWLSVNVRVVCVAVVLVWLAVVAVIVVTVVVVVTVCVVENLSFGVQWPQETGQRCFLYDASSSSLAHFSLNASPAKHNFAVSCVPAAS